MKNRPRTDKAWRLLVGLFAEVINPLLIIWLALFVCCGYILTLLMPVRIAHWTALLAITLLLSLAGLLLRFRGMTPWLTPSSRGGGGGGGGEALIGRGGFIGARCCRLCRCWSFCR